MPLRLALLCLPLLAFAAPPEVADWQKTYDSWYWKAPATRLENLRWSDNGEFLVFSERGSATKTCCPRPASVNVPRTVAGA